MLAPMSKGARNILIGVRICTCILTTASFSCIRGKVVLVNFYADWCRFSQMLKPVYKQAAQLLGSSVNAKLGQVNCEDPRKICDVPSPTRLRSRCVVPHGARALRVSDVAGGRGDGDGLHGYRRSAQKV